MIASTAQLDTDTVTTATPCVCNDAQLSPGRRNFDPDGTAGRPVHR